MKRILKFFRVVLLLVVVAVALGAAALGGAYFYFAPTLPDTEQLKAAQLQIPLRVYSRDKALIAEFGEKKRSPVTVAETPPQLVRAFLAAEDDRFYSHPGVDYQGILRAAWELARTGERRQGGSTITMQVARNFLLTREKTYVRKVKEILLALKIERELDKDEILELYLNKIYLGHRAYGVGAAAQVYYGTDVGGLTLAQQAMIAGLPKAPSRNNPVTAPQQARERRDYVLRRMRALGFIDEQAYQEAVAARLTARLGRQPVELEAPYVAEMVRAELVERYGNDAYTRGLRAYTTIRRPLQEAANRGLRGALLSYGTRHGYRGPEKQVTLSDPQDPAERERWLEGLGPVADLTPGLVVEVQEKSARVHVGNRQTVEIPWEGLSWARAYRNHNAMGPKPKKAADVLSVGDVVRVRKADDGQWRLAQVPQTEGALVSLDPDDGAILALVGGFDFYRSKFNRVTQAQRQPGSGFKPFVYSAALAGGYTPASLINDAPVVFDDVSLEGAWRPENYSGKFYGPTRMRVALRNSRNLVSIRLLRAVGIDTVVQYAGRFGFDVEKLPRNLSLALGSATLTPLEMATAYCVLANGGHRVAPHVLTRVENEHGEVLFEADPARVCKECELPVLETADAAAAQDAAVDPQHGKVAPRVISPQVHYQINSLLRDVIRRGTGRGALQLNRQDLAGKTGTTNDQRDAWFSGFNAKVVAVAWVGFDSYAPLGGRETGSRAALPMWIDYMRTALEGMPDQRPKLPAGMVSLRIDPESGLLADAGTPGAIFETFRKELAPKRMADPVPVSSNADAGGQGGAPIF